MKTIPLIILCAAIAALSFAAPELDAKFRDDLVAAIRYLGVEVRAA